MKKKTGKVRLLIAGIIFFSLGSFTAFSIIGYKNNPNKSIESSDNKKQESENSKKNSKDKEANNNDKNKDEQSQSETKDPITAGKDQPFTQDTAKAREVMEMLKTRVDSDKEKKIAYLTFDDGPSTTVTPLVLDILKENNIKATFFVLRTSIEKSEKSKELLKRIANEGHTIGNHTYSHDYKLLYPNRTVNPKSFLEDLEKNNKAISQVLGEGSESKIIRFPGGHASWKGTAEVDKLLEEKGFVYIEWNSLIGDAEGKKRNKDELIERFKETRKYVASDNDLVILMHDTYGKEKTAKALPEIINILKSEGYEFSTLH